MRFPTLNKDSQEIDTEKAEIMIDYAYTHGVNYFDTAYPYHEGLSEPTIGNILKKYPRDSFYLADKLPLWLKKISDEASMKAVFEEQLERCQVDYFDFYLAHSLNANLYDKMKRIKAFEYLSKEKENGRIKHLGFSFHDTPEQLEIMLHEFAWDFCQIQLNYLDWTLINAKKQYELIEAAGIPCIVMEPVRGGGLATLNDKAAAILREAHPDASIASWAMRFAASLPNTLTVLSGMSTLEQVEDNVKTMETFQPFTDEERSVLSVALEHYWQSGAIPCTGCRYCMDCPSGVNIPEVFSAFNLHSLNNSLSEFKSMYGSIAKEHRASNCVSCGICTPLCPQHINIPQQMSIVTEFAQQHKM